MSAPLYATPIKKSYQQLFDSMVINPGRMAEVDAVVNKIQAAKNRYQALEKITKVPWFFIGLLHSMESGNSFSRHLHNGDPLTGRTVNVPRGMPAANPKRGALAPSQTNPYTFEESAIDALEYMKRTSPAWKATGNDWSLPAMLYRMEAFNGWGYRRLARPIPSPYLWAASNHYTRGKYVADGQYDPNAVSKQIGTAVALARLLEKNGLLAQYRGSGGGAVASLAALFSFFFS